MSKRGTTFEQFFFNIQGVILVNVIITQFGYGRMPHYFSGKLNKYRCLSSTQYLLIHVKYTYQNICVVLLNIVELLYIKIVITKQHKCFVLE